MTMSLNEFLAKSLKLVDDQDVNRELTDVQISYSSELFKKDLQIADLDRQIENVKNSTDKLNANNNELKSKLNTIKISL